MNIDGLVKDAAWVERVYYACVNGQLSELKLLLIDDEFTRPFGVRHGSLSRSPLHLCCSYGHLECVKWMLTTMNYYYVCNSDMFVSACGSGNVELVHYLYKRSRQNVNHLVTHGESIALYEAAPYPQVVEFLLEKGAAVDPVVTGGTTPLKRALTGGYLESAMLLIEHGASLSHVNIGYKWAREYQHEVRTRRRRCVNATVALMVVFHRKRVPKDLTQHVAKRFVKQQGKAEEWLPDCIKQTRH